MTDSKEFYRLEEYVTPVEIAYNKQLVEMHAAYIRQCEEFVQWCKNYGRIGVWEE